MSDDTPTQRFPSADSGDFPTQRIDTAPVQSELQDETKKSKGLLIGLIIAGALLLAAIITILFVLFGRAPTETSTPTPSATPTPTEDAPPPPPAGPTISEFSVSNDTVLCNTQSPVPSHQYIAFEWHVADSSRVYFGIDTDDASVNQFFDNLPQNGTSQNDFPSGYNDWEYQCPSPTHNYTLTADDSDGNKVSKSVTVVNEGDTQ
jgi:hypothetical protein